MLTHKVKRFFLFATLITSALVISAVPFSTTKIERVTAQKPAQQGLSAAEKHAKLVENFRAGNDLLQKEGVPFDPNELLSPGWRAKLKPVFAGVPQMHAVRRLGAQIEGALLAD